MSEAQLSLAKFKLHNRSKAIVLFHDQPTKLLILCKLQVLGVITRKDVAEANAKLALGRKANLGLTTPSEQLLRAGPLPFIPYGAYDPTVGRSSTQLSSLEDSGNLPTTISSRLKREQHVRKEEDVGCMSAIWLFPRHVRKLSSPSPALQNIIG